MNYILSAGEVGTKIAKSGWLWQLTGFVSHARMPTEGT
ncbi:MAG: hypothetical protein ANABAC_2495 [Anaerolineae bacterium]|nr:MAG: hypothetical protein ANABAC_2495 [Anaerolineae bacterium]